MSYLARIRAYGRTFLANHRAFGNVAEDPAPRYSAADREDGLWHAAEQQQVFYTSADAAGPDATWSVYVERYASADAAEPIVGSTHRLSSWPSEVAAEAEANRLAEQGLAMPPVIVDVEEEDGGQEVSVDWSDGRVEVMSKAAFYAHRENGRVRLVG